MVVDSATCNRSCYNIPEHFDVSAIVNNWASAMDFKIRVENHIIVCKVSALRLICCAMMLMYFFIADHAEHDAH
jgi:hypothetical protein